MERQEPLYRFDLDDDFIRDEHVHAQAGFNNEILVFYGSRNLLCDGKPTDLQFIG